MIDGLQHHFPHRVTEWLLSVILTSWGLACLVVTQEAWQIPALSGLSRLAPKEVWGFAALLIGATRLCALFINGAMYRTPHMRALGAFLSLFIWLQLSFGMLTADLITMALGVYPWFIFADLHNLYRAGRDARFSDQKLKAMRSGESTRDAKPA